MSDADESSRFDFAVVKYRPLLGTDEDEDEWVSSGPSPRGAAGASSSSATALVPARPSTDVLLARLQRQPKRGPTGGILRHTDDSTGQAAFVLVQRGNERGMRPTKTKRHT